MEATTSVRPGIRGWLILPTVWLVYAAWEYLRRAIRSYWLAPKETSIIVPPSLVESSAPYVEPAVLALLFLFACTVLYHFFARHRAAPAWYIAFSLAALVSGIAKWLWAGWTIRSGKPLAVGELEVTVVWAIVGVLLIPYLLVSKRAKATFSSFEGVLEMTDALRYAGFSPRALALVTDLIIVLCLFAVQQAVVNLSISVGLFSYLIVGIISVAYPVYFHTRWGQTLGKMLARIKVTRVDGNAIGLSHALLRSSVDIGLWAIWAAGMIYVLTTWTGPEWSSLGFLDRGREIADRSPVGHWSYDVVVQLWLWSELVVLLTNKKRRALHDFIAGTVVVHSRTRQMVVARPVSFGTGRLESSAPGPFGLSRRASVILAVALAILVLFLYQLLFMPQSP